MGLNRSRGLVRWPGSALYAAKILDRKTSALHPKAVVLEPSILK